MQRRCFAASLRPPSNRALRQAVETLETRTLLSSTWFVSPSGSDQGAGTIAAPFQTIQHAADLAQAGDHVEIRAGSYHETVTPANSGVAGAPIVFEAYNGEQVFVSGADPVSNWSSYSGSIYTAAMPWTLGEGNDQVFVDGRMINEARWPNTSLDVSHPTLAHAQRVVISGSTATIYDPALTQPAGYWKGAIIHITPGQAWIAQTGTVVSSSPGQLTYSFIPLDKYELPKAGNAYYLTGTFKALDSAGEWFRDNGGKVYVWTPTGDSPANHDVEVKHRSFAFDVSGDSYITIQNVNLFAASINSDDSSSNLVVNHTDARYVGQFLSLPHGWDVPTRTGIVLAGNNSIFENSTVAYGAGDGVLVMGANARVTNNIIHDTGYNAADTAAIRVLGSGAQVDHNTIYDIGRSGILHTAAGLKILYNVIHDAGLQTTEAGGIYTVGTNGGGTEIAYNKIYNMHSGGFGETGLFLDNNSNNFVVDHNQVWNVDHALKMNFTCRNDNIYNNTLDGSLYSVFTNQKGDWDGTKLTKNVFLKAAVFNTGAQVSNNASVATPGLGAGDFASGATGDTVDVSPPVVTPPVKAPPVKTPPIVTPPVITPPVVTPPVTTPPITGVGMDIATQPPAAPPSPTDYLSLLAADRAAIKSAKLTRSQHLKDLAAIIKSDAQAYRSAIRQFRIAQRAAKKARLISASLDPTVAALSADVQNLLQTVQNDRLTSSAARHSDFSGIQTAKQALAADQRAYRKSRHR